MCLSWTNTGLYYIYRSLLSLYRRLDISSNHSIYPISWTVTLCPPYGCERGPYSFAPRRHTTYVLRPWKRPPLYLVELCSHDLIHHRTEVLIRPHSRTKPVHVAR